MTFCRVLKLISYLLQLKSNVNASELFTVSLYHLHLFKLYFEGFKSENLERCLIL